MRVDATPNCRQDSPPLVSLLIPAYSPRYFEACLASAIGQSYPNLEILVCDDSGGGEIEASVARSAGDRPMHYVRNPTRLKARANYARCFALAGGEFVKYLNDDDLLAADCVERMVAAFSAAPNLVLATSYRMRIDGTGARLRDQPATRPLVDADSIVEGRSLANFMILAGLNVVGEPTTTMFRKADLERAIPGAFRFDDDGNIGIIDMCMWAALLLQGDAVYLRDGLSSFRIHPDQQQHEPWIRELTVTNIRRLQASWLARGLCDGLPTDGLLVRPLADPEQPWQVRGIAPPTRPPRLWRYC